MYRNCAHGVKNGITYHLIPHVYFCMDSAVWSSQMGNYHPMSSLGSRPRVPGRVHFDSWKIPSGSHSRLSFDSKQISVE